MKDLFEVNVDDIKQIHERFKNDWLVPEKLTLDEFTNMYKAAAIERIGLVLEEKLKEIIEILKEKK